MKKKKNNLSLLISRHVIYSGLAILAWTIISISIFTHGDFDLKTLFLYLLIYLLSSIPIFLAVYINYLLLSKKNIYTNLVSPFILVIGAILLPAVFFCINKAKYDPNYVDWGSLFVFLISGNNLILLIINEILLLVNYRKLK